MYFALTENERKQREQEYQKSVKDSMAEVKKKAEESEDDSEDMEIEVTPDTINADANSSSSTIRFATEEAIDDFRTNPWKQKNPDETQHRYTLVSKTKDKAQATTKGREQRWLPTT